MKMNEPLLAAVSAASGAAGAWALIRFRLAKAERDLKGLSIRESENTRKERRRFIFRVASDLEAAAPGNAEVKRLAQLLREDVS